MRKPRSQEEVFNDLDQDVVNYFRVLQDRKQRKELCVRLLLTPYSRTEYARSLDIIQNKENDPIKRAWAFFIAANLGYPSKAPGLARKGSFVTDSKITSATKWRQLVASIESVAWRFREVLIECRSWEKVVERHDNDDTFFYADPPYVWSARTTNGMYMHEMADNEHREMITMLSQAKSQVMVSGYPSPLYDQLLSGWRRCEFNAICSIAKGSKPKRTEVIWMNYDQHGRKLTPGSNVETE